MKSVPYRINANEAIIKSTNKCGKRNKWWRFWTECSFETNHSGLCSYIDPIQNRMYLNKKLLIDAGYELGSQRDICLCNEHTYNLHKRFYVEVISFAGEKLQKLDRTEWARVCCLRCSSISSNEETMSIIDFLQRNNQSVQDKQVLEILIADAEANLRHLKQEYDRSS